MSVLEIIGLGAVVWLLFRNVFSSRSSNQQDTSREAAPRSRAVIGVDQSTMRRIDRNKQSDDPSIAMDPANRAWAEKYAKYAKCTNVRDKKETSKD